MLCIYDLLLIPFVSSTNKFSVTYTWSNVNSSHIGKGLPFFTTTLPGVVKTEENKKSTGNIAKQVRDELLPTQKTEAFCEPSTNTHHLNHFFFFFYLCIMLPVDDDKSYNIHKQLGTYGK